MAPRLLAEHKPFGFESAKCLADRCAGQRELLGDPLFDQALAGLVVSFDDRLADLR